MPQTLTTPIERTTYVNDQLITTFAVTDEKVVIDYLELPENTEARATLTTAQRAEFFADIAVSKPHWDAELVNRFGESDGYVVDLATNALMNLPTMGILQGQQLTDFIQAVSMQVSAQENRIINVYDVAKDALYHQIGEGVIT